MGSPQISPTIHHSPRSGCASAVVMRLVEEEEEGHRPLTIAGADANIVIPAGGAREQKSITQPATITRGLPCVRSGTLARRARAVQPIVGVRGRSSRSTRPPSPSLP